LPVGAASSVIAHRSGLRDALPMDFHAELLLLRVDDLQTRLDAPERAWVLEDLAALTLEVCERVSPVLQIPRLEATFVDSAQLDADALRQAVNLLKAAGSPALSHLAAVPVLGQGSIGPVVEARAAHRWF
jgi:hypothetical protein